MDAPSLSLKLYTFKYDTIGFTTQVKFGGADDYVRSVMLSSMGGASDEFYLTYEDNAVLLNFPNIPAVNGQSYTKIPLRFVVGYTDYDDENFDEADVVYETIDVNVYATRYDDYDPKILYIENLASRVGESTEIVIHGENLTDGLSVTIVDGQTEYVVTPDNIVFKIDEYGVGTATFTLFPGMLAVNADGSEPCGQYDIFFSYGNQHYQDEYSTIGLIRYKYDSETDELQRYSTESVTREKMCYTTGTMSLVYDTEDENGNAVLNPEADPKLGKDIYVKKRVYTDPVMIFGGPVDKYGLRTQKSDGFVLNDGDLVLLTYQDNDMDNGYWIVRPTFWKHVHNCDEFIYTMVRVKYNKNLTHKNGLLTLNGIKLHEGDVVWLSHQMIESENGLWVVNAGAWNGYNPYTYDPDPTATVDCHVDCIDRQLPYTVDDSVLIDLGVKATYPVDVVCRNHVPYKCGIRLICNHKVVPGNVVALLNQTDSTPGNGIYLVKCGAWEKLADVTEDMVNGTTVDFTNNVIIQNDIDFCQCGGVFHIDYFFLTPSCYVHHLQRTVKVMCAAASIAPNSESNQFSITEYQIRVGEEDALIGNRDRTPGDPVKESCTQVNEDFDVDFGLELVEHRQYVEDPPCIQSPMCTSMCDIPRIYNLRMTSDYTSSNDQNGFTIKFWRYERNSWHLYAYIGSGTQQLGMDYYVYHLRVDGKATENLVDENEHDWFNVTTGVIASGDGADSFGICDDTWESHNLRTDTLYKPWRIKCTTNLLAHCYDDPDNPHILRTTCADMEIGWKTTAAVGDEDVHGYLYGMPHLYGVAYYKTAMTKSQFVAEYNKCKPKCIMNEIRT